MQFILFSCAAICQWRIENKFANAKKYCANLMHFYLPLILIGHAIKPGAYTNVLMGYFMGVFQNINAENLQSMCKQLQYICFIGYHLFPREYFYIVCSYEKSYNYTNYKLY